MKRPSTTKLLMVKETLTSGNALTRLLGTQETRSSLGFEQALQKLCATPHHGRRRSSPATLSPWLETADKLRYRL